jgi:predicted nucleic acid-binding protein
MRIVSNSSPLIALAKIGMLDVLSGVIIPKAVFDEITKPEKEYAKGLDKWGKDKVIAVKNRKAVEYLEMILDRGEAETIAFAEELNADAVLIDDLKARKIAKFRELNVIGTLGVLLDAKERELIRDVKPLLEKLMKEKIRISKELYDHALDLANEKKRLK